MLGINEEAYFSPSLSAEGGEACLKRFEGGDTGGELFQKFPPRERLLILCEEDAYLLELVRAWPEC